jgi:ribonuclease HI
MITFDIVANNGNKNDIKTQCINKRTLGMKEAEFKKAIIARITDQKSDVNEEAYSLERTIISALEDINAVEFKTSEQIWESKGIIKYTAKTLREKKKLEALEQTHRQNIETGKHITITNDNIDRVVEKRKTVARMIRKDETQRWREHVEELNGDTDLNKMWKTVNSMKNKKSGKQTRVKMNDESGRPLLKTKEIADEYGRWFNELSKQPKNSDTSTGIRTENRVKQTIAEHMRKNKNNKTKTPFKMAEMNDAIQHSNTNSAPGHDRISYFVLKRLPIEMLERILTLFNMSWENSEVPQKWKEGIVTILPKTCSSNQPKQYRPITLLPVIGKLMERMIGSRLNYHLEQNQIIPKTQTGFRENGSTEHQLVRLVQEAKEAWANQQEYVVTFLDVEKAFDKVWHDGLIAKMIKLKIPDEIVDWTIHYLKNRKIRVKVNGIESEEYSLFTGVPQGGVLSPMLFNIYMYDLNKGLRQNVQIYQFADDSAIGMRIPKGGAARSNAIIEYQKTIDKITSWFGKWKLPIAESKTNIKIFTRKTTTKPFPIFVGAHLHNPDETLKDTVKYLGLTLDAGLKFNAHFNEVGVKVNMRMNILKAIGGFSWGSDRGTLIKIYKAWIQPVILYGSNAMVALNKAQRKRLARMQLACLRVASGCNKWVPTDLIEVEMNVMPIELEMGKKLLVEAISIERMDESNPLKKKWNQTKQKIKKHVPLPSEPNKPDNKNISQPNTPLGQALRWYCGTTFQQNDEHKQELSTKPDPTAPRERQRTTLWPTLGAAGTRSLAQKIEASKYGRQTATKWSKLVEDQEGILYYTDGSAEMPKHNINATISWGGISGGYYKLDYKTKTDDKRARGVGCMGDNVLGEMAAIDMALDDAVREQRLKPRDNPMVVILSDCQEAIHLTQDENRKTIYEHCKENINEKMGELELLGVKVAIDWVPGHSNTAGNEIADGIAKRSLRRARTDDIKNVYEVPKEATKQSVKAIMNTVWQRWWNRWDHTRSYAVMKEVGKASPLRHSGEVTRREMTVLTRLRVGNATNNASLHKTKRFATPECQCGTTDSTEHRMFECSQYKKQRRELYETMDEHNIEHNIYDLMKFENKTASEATEIITAILKYLNDTNLTTLFVWDPTDEEHGVEGLVLMRPADASWAKPVTD